MSTDAPFINAGGRPPLPRVRATRAFLAHVQDWMQREGMRVPALCAAAYNGDNSQTAQARTREILTRAAIPDSPTLRSRVSRLVRITGFDRGTLEPLEPLS